MRNDVLIRPERKEEFDEIDRMVRDSFAKGTAYSDGASEVALIHEIRAKRYYIPELSFVAEVDGDMAGHFMLSHFPLSPSPEAGRYDREIVKTPVVMLAPVAVAPKYFRQGVGTAMLAQGIERARGRGYRGIQVEGNPAFYNTLGFVTSTRFRVCCLPADQWLSQHPDCLMMMELFGGALDGLRGYVDYGMYDNA